MTPPVIVFYVWGDIAERCVPGVSVIDVLADVLRERVEGVIRPGTGD